ncbi:pyridoxamine 5'-phosphate oxidase [Streptomyces sp. NPDC059122]|uniref:pyridoxamine 5'-phosphate oxidase family protein n=1 Tax=Streptomyces sp. NPDC059122 TaxID=3346732 RepID=UPI003685BCDB
MTSRRSQPAPIRISHTPRIQPPAHTHQRLRKDSPQRAEVSISSGTSKKVRNIRAAGQGARVAVSQAEGRRWCTLEGTAVVKDDPESVADAEARYAQRYKTPRPNPERVVIEITITHAMGTAKPPGW